MQLHDIRTLYAFNYWALQRIMGIVSNVSEDEYGKDRASSHGGIRGTLVHTMGAEEIWLKRWQGIPITGGLKEIDFPSFNDLAQRWSAIERDVLQFCDSLKSDADVQRIFEYKDLRGNPYSSWLGDAMQHLVNHSTYHRGQVVTMLRQAGIKPVATDMIAYFRERDAKPN